MVRNAYFFIASLILGYEMEKYALFVVMCEFMWRKKQIVLAFEKQSGFIDQILLGSCTKIMFKKRIRVSHNTFQYFCEKMGVSFKKQHTYFRNPILMEDRVAMSLIWLGSGNGLQLVGDLFGVTKGTISVILKKFCHMIRVYLWKLFCNFQVSINLGFCQKNLKLYMEFRTSHSSTFHRRRRLLL
jgi:hypothetical protein